MLANYHTHTYLSHHACDEPRQYVEYAIKNGLKVLGFSDHVPYPFKNGFYSDYHIDLKDSDKYVDIVLSLKKEYKNDIEILLGYEAEYYPKDFEDMIKFISDYDYDYLILGQHFTFNEYDGHYVAFNSTDKRVLTQYVDQIIKGIDTGLFSVVAHPDLVNVSCDKEFKVQEFTRLCKHAKNKNIPLEINLLGLVAHRNYPVDMFWEIASKIGNDVILGYDAHNASRVGDKSEEQRGRDYAAKFGITTIDYLNIEKKSTV